jgi:hypothetical protein
MELMVANSSTCRLSDGNCEFPALRRNPSRRHLRNCPAALQMAALS